MLLKFAKWSRKVLIERKSLIWTVHSYHPAETLKTEYLCNGDGVGVTCKSQHKLVFETIKLGTKRRSAGCSLNSALNQARSTQYRQRCCSADQSNDCIQVTDDVSGQQMCTGRSNCVPMPALGSSKSCGNIYGTYGSYTVLEYYCIDGKYTCDVRESKGLRNCFSELIKIYF